MGTVYLSEQMTGFLLSIALGAALSCFYTVMKSLIPRRSASFFAVVVSDIFFWAVTTVLTFLFLIIYCKGKVRLYVIFGEICGFVIFRAALSKPLSAAIGFLIKIFSLAAGLIIKPVGFVYGIITVPLKKVRKILKKVAEIPKKLLKDIRGMLYNLSNCKGKTEKELNKDRNENFGR